MKNLIIIFIFLFFFGGCGKSKIRQTVRTFSIETTSLNDSILVDTIQINQFDTSYLGSNKNLENMWLIDRAIFNNWSNNHDSIHYKKDVVISFDTSFYLQNRQVTLDKYSVATTNPNILYYGYFLPKNGTVFWKSAEGFDKIRLTMVQDILTGCVDSLIDVQYFIDSIRDVHFRIEFKNINLEGDTIDEIEHNIEFDDFNKNGE